MGVMEISSKTNTCETVKSSHTYLRGNLVSGDGIGVW